MLIKKIIDIQNMYYVFPFFHRLEMLLFLGSYRRDLKIKLFIEYFVFI
jgi:hypothetical protein